MGKANRKKKANGEWMTDTRNRLTELPWQAGLLLVFWASVGQAADNGFSTKRVVNGSITISPTWNPATGHLDAVLASPPDRIVVDGRRLRISDVPIAATARVMPHAGHLHLIPKSRYAAFQYAMSENKQFLGGWQHNRILGGLNGSKGPDLSKVIGFAENLRPESDIPGRWWYDHENQQISWSPGMSFRAGDSENGEDRAGATEGWRDAPWWPYRHASVYPEEDEEPSGEAQLPPIDMEKVKAAKFAIIPKDAKQLKSAVGTADEPKRNIVIENAIFRHTARTFMDTKEPLLRSDWRIYRGGALFIENAESVIIRNCIFEDLGGNAIFISGYAKDITIENCEFRNIGANAICIIGRSESVRSPQFAFHDATDLDEMDQGLGPVGWPQEGAESPKGTPDLNLNEAGTAASEDTPASLLDARGRASYSPYPRNITIRNCLIQNTGMWEPCSAGVLIAMAMDVTIENCTIEKTPGPGICIASGCWGGHRIEGNDVFDTMWLMKGMGALMAWGRDRHWHWQKNKTRDRVKAHPDMPKWDTIKPIVIRGNRFHAFENFAVNLHDGSSNYIVENNVFLAGGLTMRPGFHREFRNNVFAKAPLFVPTWYGRNGDIFERNIFCIDRKIPIRAHHFLTASDHNFVHAHWRGTNPAAFLQRLTGKDQHSLTGNADFVDYFNGDYRIKKFSPAHDIGFKNFDMDSFGVTDLDLRAKAGRPPLPK
ncbi:MAG: hypothetical protein ACI8W8_003287 [Rhodothermales bacterium]|jgi:hypothetical protein